MAHDDQACPKDHADTDVKIFSAMPSILPHCHPCDMDAAAKAKMETLWNDRLAPFAARQREPFRREMRHGQMVELRNTNHQAILNDPRVIAEILAAARPFLLAE